MPDDMTFEAGYEKLEHLTEALERGDMPLDQSFAAYEEAVTLLKSLCKQLDEGDARVRALTESGEEVDFDAGEDAP